MIYYDNALRLRLPHNEIYRIHQNLDFFIQEKLNIKTPYSFKSTPGTANDTLILIRTAQSLSLPGEVKKSINISEGDELEFISTMAVVKRENQGERKREVQPTPEELDHYVQGRIERSGFSVHFLNVSKSEIYSIKKPGTKILIPASIVKSRCKVNSVELAENSIVYGIGRKRVFGFGFLSVMD
ncbi:type I-E CRISPR-associated protein Cas6/Cse3/CasE [Dickeya sp. NCPPB 3274]|uniref:type I-E CRISPR-associated protein Cas6/Cse3/CasE n=1 Tax=Dickeya sp. NCPPB 3274 TaxID=568766 RepID=UPI0005B3B77B|nr:type I-E CRISPR-associated protein Cas6/Cse3/CasE [Dickeya sp. NCPPB 3274]